MAVATELVSVSGKVAVIFGATPIGKATNSLFSQLGAKTILLSVDSDAGPKLVDIRDEGHRPSGAGVSARPNAAGARDGGRRRSGDFVPRVAGREIHDRSDPCARWGFFGLLMPGLTVMHAGLVGKSSGRSAQLVAEAELTCR
jgi:NAD(P)-dependent dehydrogenase (short-subunit alcohol dehydrogenase family)